MQPDLSIVVVHWNVAGLLAGCLRSIEAEIACSGLAVEVVVVDNASPDRRFRDVVASASSARLLELTENHGYAAGCNSGIRATSGQAVLLLNPDVEVLPGSVRALHEMLHVAPHIAMTAPLLLNSDGTLQSDGYRFPGVANVFFDLFPTHPRLVESPLNGRVSHGDGVQPIRIDYPLGAAMLVRRTALEAVGLLDETYGMYCEEIDLAKRLADAGWTVVLTPTARVIHHGGQSTSQHPATMHEALWLSRARYYGRYGSRRQRALVAALVEVGTRIDDRRAGADRRRANRRIRQAFRRIARVV